MADTTGCLTWVATPRASRAKHFRPLTPRAACACSPSARGAGNRDEEDKVHASLAKLEANEDIHGVLHNVEDSWAVATPLALVGGARPSAHPGAAHAGKAGEAGRAEPSSLANLQYPRQIHNSREST